MSKSDWSGLQEKLSEANGFFSVMEEAKKNRINKMINWVKSCLPPEEAKVLKEDGIAGEVLFNSLQKLKEKENLGLIAKILEEQGYLRHGRQSVEKSLVGNWWPCHSDFPYNRKFFDNFEELIEKAFPLPAKIQMQMPAATITIGNSISVVKVGVGNTG